MSRYFPSPAECGHHTIFGNIPAITYAGEHLQVSVVDIPPDGIVEWQLEQMVEEFTSNGTSEFSDINGTCLGC